MFKKILPLIMAPLVSCGCPSNTTPETPTEPIPSVVIPKPSASIPEPSSKPEPRPVPKISWKKSTDREIIDMIEENKKCFVLLFKSNKEEMNVLFDKVFSSPEIVSVINERFKSILWVGEDEVRVEQFGVEVNQSGLLLIPTDNSNYLLFNPFDELGVPKSNVDDIKLNLLKGLSSPYFDKCESGAAADPI